jgi:hypothetical protein
VPEHQLDDPDVDVVCQESAGAFVTQIVPVPVNLLQLLAIDSDAMLGALGVVSVGGSRLRRVSQPPSEAVIILLSGLR